MAVPTSGIDHVHLNVEALELLIERFTSLLACRHNLPFHVESIDALNSMNSLGLDVFQPAGEGICAKQMRGFGGPGLTTVSLLVEDIDAATRHIEGCGTRVISRIGYPGVEVQTQFHPKDCFGMVLELIEYEEGHADVIAEIHAQQARENDGVSGIDSPEGALATRGIDHVHLHVGDLDDARRWFEARVACQWEPVSRSAEDARIARGSLGIHLVETPGRPGLGSLAFGVDELGSARERLDALGYATVAAPEHESDACLRVDPAALCGLALELVPPA